MYPKNIHNFIMGGVIKDDKDFPRLREEQEKMLIQQMNDKGYVPVLDMMPQFSVKYNEERDQYGFQLIMYGMYLGKKKALQYEGFSGQGLIPKGK